jgi:hypothetical protein
MRPGVRYRKKRAAGGIEAISEHWEIVIRTGSVSCSAHKRRIFGEIVGLESNICRVVLLPFKNIRLFFFSSHFCGSETAMARDIEMA